MRWIQCHSERDPRLKRKFETIADAGHTGRDDWDARPVYRCFICRGAGRQIWSKDYLPALSLIWFSLFSLICGFSFDFWSFAIFRFIEGIGLGAEVPIVASYAADFVPAKKRGALMSLYQSCFILGIILSSLLGWLIVPRWGWRVLLGFGAIPVLLAVWLRRACRIASLATGEGKDRRGYRCRGKNRGVSKRALGLIRSNNNLLHFLRRQLPRDKVCLRGVLQPPSCLGVWFACFASSYGLTTWRPAVFSAAGVPLSQALFWTFVTTLVGVPGFLLAAWLLDKVGRKSVGVGAFAISVVGNFMFGESSNHLLRSLSGHWYYNVPAGLPRRCFTPGHRNSIRRISVPGNQRGQFCRRAGQYVIPTLIGGFVLAGSMTAGYGIISGLCIIAILVIMLFGVETKKLSLEALHGQRPGQ